MCDKHIFYPERDVGADRYFSTMRDCEQKIELIVAHLNTHLSSTRGKLIEYDNDKSKNGSVYGFITTSHKGKVLKNAPIDTSLCGNIHLVEVNKDVLITSDIIGSLCQNLAHVKNQYEQYMYRCYMSTINENSNYDFFSDITTFISKLDYIKSNAKSAVKNNYYRPTIISTDSDVSFLDIKDLRHPVSEQLISGKYVTNDISLGYRPYGILLYGANSIGKSTLTKAIGLNIIMAQAGMFTACQLKYKPYNKIITRLSGEDNLIQGKSSFIIEMSELRTILRNADSRTLVLGDELCRGTETQSGSAIAIKSILELHQRKTSFIFSTHMHHLATDPDILKINTDELRICHLAIKYDSTTKSLVYDRKIKEGSGESIYGLEVAMSLSFDPDFIKGASEIRTRMIQGGNDGQILSGKKSRYNQKVYVDRCIVCGTKPGLVKGNLKGSNKGNNKGNGNIELHSHHIEEQANANSNGFINDFHKNKEDNIIVLCEECHKSLHANGIKVITQQTPNGKLIKIPLSNDNN